MDKQIIKTNLEVLNCNISKLNNEILNLKAQVYSLKIKSLELYLREVLIPLVNEGKIFYSYFGKSYRVNSLSINGPIVVKFGKDGMENGFYSRKFRMMKKGSSITTVPFDFPNIKDYNLTARELANFGYIMTFE